MLVLRVVVVVCLCTGFAGFAGSVANAQTPTPTSTSTPSVLPGETAPAPQPAVFGGSVWVNARRVDDRGVTAKIGDVVCATVRAPLVMPPGGGGPTYGLAVPSDEVLPGCGREGATVTFFVGDQQVSQTVVWHAGEDMRVDLIIGPPFALFFGGVGPSRLSSRQVIQPYVGNAVCGYGDANDPGDGYEAVVHSTEQQPGCGVEGSQITFKVLDAQGNVIAVAKEKGTWHAWDGISSPQQINLTFGPAGGITMPGTGTGDGSDGEGSAWARLSMLLGFVGLAGAATGFALRKRALTR